MPYESPALRRIIAKDLKNLVQTIDKTLTNISCLEGNPYYKVNISSFLKQGSENIQDAEKIMENYNFAVLNKEEN